MAETRTLAAILAADVAGYSELAGADEERTLATRKQQTGTEGSAGTAQGIAVRAPSTL